MEVDLRSTPRQGILLYGLDGLGTDRTGQGSGPEESNPGSASDKRSFCYLTQNDRS